MGDGATQYGITFTVRDASGKPCFVPIATCLAAGDICIWDFARDASVSTRRKMAARVKERKEDGRGASGAAGRAGAERRPARALPFYIRFSVPHLPTYTTHTHTLAFTLWIFFSHTTVSSTTVCLLGRAARAVATFHCCTPFPFVLRPPAYRSPAYAAPWIVPAATYRIFSARTTRCFVVLCDADVEYALPGISVITLLTWFGYMLFLPVHALYTPFTCATTRCTTVLPLPTPLLRGYNAYFLPFGHFPSAASREQHSTPAVGSTHTPPR